MLRPFSTSGYIIATLCFLQLPSCGDSDSDAIGGNGVGGNSTGGNGGAPATGGAGETSVGGGETVCTPGEQQPCYDGPPSTNRVGVCTPGSRTCLADGSGFGGCENQVLPSAETCDSPEDEDCDGEVNEEGASCFCVPGSSEACYTGPLGTERVGLCAPGTRACDADGLGFGACVGDVTPTEETCGVGGDEDCDGETNEEGSDCVCLPGSSQPCYSADPLTLGVGVCAGGTQICNADGLGYGLCTGEVTPSGEECATLDDEDCDGETIDTSDGCVCAPNQPGPCYTGPSGTLGVGNCAGGTALCNAQGTAYGTCENEVLPAAEDCTVAGDESCDGVTAACMGGQMWAHRYGNSAEQTALDVATDAAGNVVMTGKFMGQIDFGGGPLVSAGQDDAYLAKLDSAGNHLWSKRFGNFTTQRGRSVATDAAGNVIVAGYFAGTVDFGGGPLIGAGGSDVFVAKFDAAGSYQWSKQFGNTGTEDIGQVTVDGSDNIIVTGLFEGTIDLGGGPLASLTATDAFVLKLDADGNHIWSKRYDTANSWSRINCATDAAGNIVLTGRFQNPISFGGLTFSSSGTGDMFVAKLDANGDHVWSQSFGGSGIDTGERVALDSAGNVLLTGTFNSATIDFGGGSLVNANAGNNDMFLVKLASWGGHLWSKRFGGTTDDRGLAVTSDAAGNVFVGAAGGSGLDLGGGALPGSSGATVGMFDASGTHVWSYRYGNSGDDVITVTTDPAGDLLFTGSFNGSIDFGGGALTSAGSYDVYIVKLGP